MDIKKIVKGKLYYVTSFILPIIIMMTVYAMLNQWPFGDRSLIVNWDIKEQYSNYYAYLKTILQGENNFIYSFSKVMGGDMIGLTGYYLASPINVLFILLKNVKIDIVIMIVTLLKLGLCSLTFNFFVTRKNGRHFYNFLFSTSYALMAYNIVYQQNLMWLDGVFLLPLVLAGIDKLIKNESFLLYVSSLSLAILSNYYIGYMVGITSLLYYVYKKVSDPGDFKALAKKTISFIFYTALSVGLTLFFLLPVFESLKGGKGPDENGGYLADFSLQFNPMDFFSKMYTGAFAWREVMDGLPLVFCGWFVFVLVVLFFMNKEFSRKQKIVSFVFMLVLMLGMQVTSFIAVWHGFNMPTGFPARNSFVFSFFFIYFAYKSFSKLKTGSRPLHFLVCSVVFSAFFMATRFFKYDYLNEYNYLWSIIVCSACIIGFLLTTKCHYKKNLGKIYTAVLAVTCLLDLGCNGYISLSKYNFIDINEFKSFEEKNKKICDYIKENDKGTFYRIEKDYMRTRNDNMLLNINGLSHSSSCDKHFVKSFMGNMGFNRYGDVYATYGRGGTIFADSLLGVKYLMSSEKSRINYKEVKTFDDVTVYKNENALPVGFVADRHVKDADFKDINRFDRQNKMISAIIGKDLEIFKPCNNVTFESKNLEVKMKKGAKYYTKDNDDEDASLNYQLIVDEDGPIYLDYISPKTNNAKIKVNDDYMTYDFSDSFKQILNLGEYKKGQTLNICIELVGRRLCLDKILIYREDVNLLTSALNEIKSHESTFWRRSSSRLSGRVNVKKNKASMVFSIPYEESWNISVDGKKCVPFKTFDTLLSIDLSKGEHLIEMNYIPTTFYKGFFASVTSLILIIICWFYQQRRFK